MRESQQRPSLVGGTTTYTAYRQALEDFGQQSWARYDRVLLMLSGGTLAASLSIVPDLFENGEIVGRWMLIGVWGALVWTILCVGLSFFAAAKSAYTGIEKLDKRAMKNSLMGRDMDAEWFQPTSSWWRTIIPWLNAAGGISFAIGLVLMVIFASTNFR